MTDSASHLTEQALGQATVAAFTTGNEYSDAASAVKQAILEALKDGDPGALDAHDVADEVRGHVALMHLHLDGAIHEPDALVFVTEDEFGPLKAASVFGGEWSDGVTAEEYDVQWLPGDEKPE
ncbi:hypothetical protein [Sphingobium cloacae]|uniref:hypothetical protein n=1 Tax=Sphingobium cloacae TaxID=120107 RepID=UPI0012EED5BE|nr:hypothetical protein [Sphingobium cloacae]